MRERIHRKVPNHGVNAAVKWNVCPGIMSMQLQLQ